MWKRFLGPYSLIIGIDIDPTCKKIDQDQIIIEIGSQNDIAFLNKLTASYGPFDVVIDDGSHKMPDVTSTFKALYKSITKDGFYIIEDLHTAYWEEFGGGLNSLGSFIEFSKGVIDAMHLPYIRGEVAFDSFIKEVAYATRTITIADSIIVYEKGRYFRKHAPKIGREVPESNLITDLTF